MRCWPVLLLLACTSEEPDTDSPEDSNDTVETDTVPTEVSWDVQPIGDVPGGAHLRLALRSGGLAAAFWADETVEDGICDEIEVAPPPRIRQAVLYAEQSGDTWTTTEVSTPVVAFAPPGLSLAMRGDDPLVAVTDGVPEGQYCGGHDAVVHSRVGGTWTEEAAAVDSGDANTGDPASDAGFVLGLWPAMTLDPAGEPVILYRDAHFGALQRDDLFRADAEIAWRRNGTWTQQMVDGARGGGGQGAILIDRAGALITFYAIPVDTQAEDRQGLWAARRGLDGLWTRTHLSDSEVMHTVSAAVSPSGVVQVALYDADDARARIFSLEDANQFGDPDAWTRTAVGSPSFDEGQYAALGFLSDGRRVLASRRCRRLTSAGTDCDVNDEAIVLAIEGEDRWAYEVVDEGCGEYVSMVVAPGDIVHIGYRCPVMEEGAPVFRSFVATRSEAP